MSKKHTLDDILRADAARKALPVGADENVGHFDTPQDACPRCGQKEDIQDEPGSDETDCWVTCFDCGFQWHEPRVEE